MTDKPIPLVAVELVLEERCRQQDILMGKGYTLGHDDKHTAGQLAVLAAAYALSSREVVGVGGGLYDHLLGAVQEMGWDMKPKAPIWDLVRAGALILAELERRLRAEEREKWCTILMMEAKTRFANMVQLPRWQSHKVVGADKIVAVCDESPSMTGHWDLLCGASVPVSLELAHRVPEGLSSLGGYYVRYEDGFESWSPAEAFERGYTRMEGEGA